jgi:DNA polymerase III delta prime subunit
MNSNITITKQFLENYKLYNTYTENYKPTIIKEVITNDNFPIMVSDMIKRKKIFNLLIYGSQGIGKTCFIKACLNELYDKKSDQKKYTRILNASEKRNIGDILNLKNFFIMKNNEKDENIKIIIFDEADYLTVDAQYLLKSLMDKYKNIKFIFLCNYINNIIDSIKSRCFCYNTLKPKKDEIKKGLQRLLILENINITEKALDLLISYCDMDIRNIYTTLQCLKIYYENSIIFDFNVIKFLNIITDEKLEKLYNFLIDKQEFSIKIKNFNIFEFADLIKLLDNFISKYYTKLTFKQIIKIGKLEDKIHKEITFYEFYEKFNNIINN